MPRGQRPISIKTLQNPADFKYRGLLFRLQPLAAWLSGGCRGHAWALGQRKKDRNLLRRCIMSRKLIILVLAVLLAGLVNSASADIELKVDFAYPNEPCNPNWKPVHDTRHDGTAKDGYWIWADPGLWDLSYHDPRVAPLYYRLDPCDPNVWIGFFDANGINGTGITLMIDIGYDGNVSLKIFDMDFVGDGLEPSGTPADTS